MLKFLKDKKMYDYVTFTAIVTLAILFCKRDVSIFFSFVVNQFISKKDFFSQLLLPAEKTQRAILLVFKIYYCSITENRVLLNGR